MRFLIATASLFVGLVTPAAACQICVPFPTESAADHLIGARAVVLAREDPGRPFHYRATEVLKGDPGTEKIELFLDSGTRRTLTIFPNRSIVLVRGAGNGDDEGWRRIGMADAVFGALVRQILACAPEWKQTPRLRVEFFGKLLGHKDRQVSQLAHLEVGRAPYGEIKRLGGALSREEIHAFLQSVRYLEWHALYILLLAQSEDQRDHQFIADSFRSGSRFGTSLQLAAWATALIEVQGEKAIDLIEEEYLRNPERSAEELEQIALSFSVHGGSGHTHLRDRFVAGYGILIADHPAMTADIAKDLIAWKRTEFAREIARYVAAKPRQHDFKTTLRLRAYGRQANAKEQRQ